MRKFDFERNFRLKQRFRERIFRCPWLYLAFAAVFLVGIILGIALKKSSDVYAHYLDYSQNYYDLILTRGQSTFGLMFRRILNNVCYFTFLFFASFTIYLVFVHFIIYVYRGFLLGTICGIIIMQFGFGGVICCLFLVIPQHVITTLALILSSGCGCEYSLRWHRQRARCEVKRFFSDCLFYFICSLIGILVEQVLLLFLLRPLNFYF